MRARELGRKRDDQRFEPVLLRALDRLRKSIRIHLAGLGQLVAFNQQLVKMLMRKVHAVCVDRRAKGDGKRQNIELRVIRAHDVAAGIGNDTYSHAAMPSWLEGVYLSSREIVRKRPSTDRSEAYICSRSSSL